MARIERVALWSVLALVVGWRIGSAVAAPTREKINLGVDLAVISERLAQIEKNEARQLGDLAPYWWLTEAAKKWEKSADEAPDSPAAADWRQIARQLRKAAEPFREEGEARLAEIEREKKKGGK